MERGQGPRPRGDLYRDGEPVARLVDLPWGEDDPTHWRARRGARGEAGSCSRAVSGRRTSPPRSLRCGPGRSTRPRRSRSRPGIKDHDRVRAYVEAARTDDRASRRPSARTAGGTSPRRSIPALEELDGRLDRGEATTPPIARSWTSSAGRTSVARRRSRCVERFAPGRRRLPEARGPEPHRRAQDQQRARPGRPRRGGSGSGGSSPRREPASTASRPRPPARGSGSSASSTWAPRTCAGRRRTSSGCGSSAPTVEPVEFGHAGRSRRRRARRSATGSRTSRRRTT